MKQITRHHPLLVTLHWVLAVLIIAECPRDFRVRDDTQLRPSENQCSAGHMPGGVVIVALMAVRFISEYGH